jgi:hypothetical protein
MRLSTGSSRHSRASRRCRTVSAAVDASASPTKNTPSAASAQCSSGNRVEYRLTDHGCALQPALRALRDWMRSG